jgi:hypothetical protein
MSPKKVSAPGAAAL